MRLMPNRSAPCLEDEMQRQVAEYFSQRKFVPSNWNGYVNSMITPKVYREVRISQIGRISDIIIYITDRKIINIECKMAGYDEVIRQAKDHLSWADYSYVCFHANSYLPSSSVRDLLNNGIGLLLWIPEIFTEVIQATHNKKKDKAIHNKVLNILKKKDSIKTGMNEVKQQKTIFD